MNLLLRSARVPNGEVGKIIDFYSTLDEVLVRFPDGSEGNYKLWAIDVLPETVGMGRFTEADLNEIKKAVRQRLTLYEDCGNTTAPEYNTLLKIYGRVDKTLDVYFPDVHFPE